MLISRQSSTEYVAEYTYDRISWLPFCKKPSEIQAHEELKLISGMVEETRVVEIFVETSVNLRIAA